MRTEKYDLIRAHAIWNEERFIGKRSANIRFDAADFHRDLRKDNFTVWQHGKQFGPEWEEMTRFRAEKIANRFRNEMNQFYFGNAARRHKMQAVVTATLHFLPHWHLHFQVEIPEHKSLKDVKAFTERFVRKNSWLKTRKDEVCYCEEVLTTIGTQIYNARYGIDSVILF